MTAQDDGYVRKEDYELCEQENSNLRKILLFACQQMTADKVALVRARFADKTISEGGFVEDDADVDRRLIHEMADLICKMRDRLLVVLKASAADSGLPREMVLSSQQIVNWIENQDPYWFGVVDKFINRANEFDNQNRQRGPSLKEIFSNG